MHLTPIPPTFAWGYNLTTVPHAALKTEPSVAVAAFANKKEIPRQSLSGSSMTGAGCEMRLNRPVVIFPSVI